MIIELVGKEIANVKVSNYYGNVALTYDRADKSNCIYITRETTEMEIESINENLITLKYLENVQR